MTYLISLNAPPLGEGEARYAIIDIDDALVHAVWTLRGILRNSTLPGYGNITWRKYIRCIVFGTVPESCELACDGCLDGPIPVSSSIWDTVEPHAMRIELEGVTVTTEDVWFTCYEKHGDYEVEGMLPNNKFIDHKS